MAKIIMRYFAIWCLAVLMTLVITGLQGCTNEGDVSVTDENEQDGSGGVPPNSTDKNEDAMLGEAPPSSTDAMLGEAPPKSTDPMLGEAPSNSSTDLNPGFGTESASKSWCLDVVFPQGAVSVKAGLKFDVELQENKATLQGSLMLGVSFGLSSFKLTIGVTGYASITVTLPEGIDWSSPRTAIEWTIAYLVAEVMEESVLSRFIGNNQHNTGEEFAGFIKESMDKSQLTRVGVDQRIVAAHELIECWWTFLGHYDIGVEGDHPFVKAGKVAKNIIQDAYMEEVMDAGMGFADEVGSMITGVSSSSRERAYNAYTDFWANLFASFFLGCNQNATDCTQHDLSFDEREEFNTWDFDCNDHIATNFQEEMARSINFSWTTSSDDRKAVMSRFCWVMKSGVLLGDKGFDLTEFAWGRIDSKAADNFRDTMTNVFLRIFFPVQPLDFKKDMENAGTIIEMITNTNDAGSDFKQKLAVEIADRTPNYRAHADDGDAAGAKKLSNLMLWMNIVAQEQATMFNKLSSYYNELVKDNRSPKEMCKDCSCGITEAKLGGKLTASIGDGSFCQGTPFEANVGAEFLYTSQDVDGNCNLKAAEQTTQYWTVSVSLPVAGTEVALEVLHYLEGADKGNTKVSFSIAQVKETELSVDSLEQVLIPDTPDDVATSKDKNDANIKIIKDEATSSLLQAINKFFSTADKTKEDFVEVVKAVGEFCHNVAKAYVDKQIDDLLNKFYEKYVENADWKNAIIEALDRKFPAPEVKKTESIGLKFSLSVTQDIKGSSVLIQAVEGNGVSASQADVGSIVLSSTSATQVFSYTVE